ncbi:O-fucosyltransferase 37 [Diospyros lotus]|uniref:O-fucosyltransferase 37 n=1 Tax=Diospyros lotus TaxID=55363 RepID=UPI00224F2E69|nr:O-fucosyltransferase 37 [Diospyros lotus]
MTSTGDPKNLLITLNPQIFLHFPSLSHLSSLIFPPKKIPRNHHLCSPLCLSIISVSLSLLILIIFLGISAPFFRPISQNSSPLFFASLSAIVSDSNEDQPTLSRSAMAPLPDHGIARNLSEDERRFWQQPDGEGYRPCLHFSIEYRKASERISREKNRLLVVRLSGGLNQKRNQIIEAVVIARILEAALFLPVPEFSEIFDAEHLRKTLQADVRVVSVLPSMYLASRAAVEAQIPHNVPPFWIRARFFKQLDEEGLLVLKGLDSKLSKNLPPDLQKLRCKVAFHALRFAAPIRELGNRLARRMWIEGPYVAIHLALEKDIWIKTGCLTGLGSEYDEIIDREREFSPDFLTGMLNMSSSLRRLAGLCPLNALELARLLKALGAPKDVRIYIAGEQPFGGSRALEPLVAEFTNLVTKEKLVKEGELAPYINRSSVLAAIDYTVSLSSNVFLPSHGGDMARALQGHRAYVGHRKFIRPSKSAMLPFFDKASSISDAEFSSIMKKLHRGSQGQPEPRTNKRDRDVIAYPVPECMCNH